MFSLYTHVMKFYEIKFSGETGRIEKITSLFSNISTAFDQQFFWYNSSTGNNINATQVNEKHGD